MLSELRSIHDELTDCIYEMEDEAAKPEPDRSRLADVRWKLSRASQRRHRFIDETVYPFLLERVSEADAEKLRVLRAENAPLRAASTQHVGRWTIDQVLRNWSDYRAASAVMTASMRKRVATERAVLYPLIEQIDAHSSLANWKHWSR